MAILVRYDENTKAIYLSQAFYALIHRKARKETSGYTTLREIALLKYKSPTMEVGGDRLANLIADLKRLMEWRLLGRQETSAFLAVCEGAAAAGRTLLVSGDMYPEL